VPRSTSSSLLSPRLPRPLLLSSLLAPSLPLVYIRSYLYVIQESPRDSLEKAQNRKPLSSSYVL